ncbi:hypothetical protein [Celeribacter neptunius]|uniref:Uncharacterized protein n=1 Tax=Celeribacter neptunius TaxID=588602 RepID=A0A1I3N478_9RHOB|nr:hypothetical protein [Celeribacter neptunius]SFJ04051.1 hypothetical protein SAMN04487991_1257 [Celeribacter neptunius]
MSGAASVKRRLMARMALLLAVWLVVLFVARGASPDGMFGALLIVLSYGIPIAAPVIAWLDWRWLNKQEGGE